MPDEVLLEIFDTYRQGIDAYDHLWRKKYVWLGLAHVCRRWRAVMFASSSRLDLSITVGPHKPAHIKAILASPLPISIEYECFHGDTTGSALWRMRAALRHHDRVREISFGGPNFHGDRIRTERMGVFFGKFIRATSYHFPALESLVLYFLYDHEPDIPPTFLRGPDQSDLRLQRLRLYEAPLASISGLLLSATALTDLTLTNSRSNAAVFGSSEGSFLLTCLQGMQSLCSLDLTAPYFPRDFQFQHSFTKDIVPLLKLTRFHYSGPTIPLNNLMSGLSVPSLQDARFVLCARIPFLYFSRVINDVRDEFRSISVAFDIGYFSLSSSIHSGKIDRFTGKPSFRFTMNCSPDSIKSISTTPSTKFAMAEELALFVPTSNVTEWEHIFSLREFLRQFRSIKVLRVDPFIREVALYLQQDDEEGILPLLEEIELSIPRLTRDSDEEYQRRADEALATFEPFVSARERAGSLVKVYHSESTLSR